jgi:hypothetical protein
VRETGDGHGDAPLRPENNQRRGTLSIPRTGERERALLGIIHNGGKNQLKNKNISKK